jgi:hypothetical protein
MVWYFNFLGLSWLGKKNVLNKNSFSSAPTLGVNNNRSLIKPEVCRYQPKPKAEVDNGKLRS